jgi:preprotein translocase subunit SecD
MNAWTTVRATVLLLFCFALMCGAQKPRLRSGKLVLALKLDAADLSAKFNRTASVIKNRCVRFRIRCRIDPNNKDGDNHLSITFSSTSELERVKDVLLGVGLEVRAVESKPFPTELRSFQTRQEALEAAGGNDVLPLIEPDRELYVVVSGTPILTGDDLRNCRVFRDQRLNYGVDCDLRPHGATRLESWTGANIHRYMAVVLNRRATSVGYIKAPISFNIEITGIPERAMAREVAHIFESGNLPLPFDIVEEEISP